jgi:hypothetical protein
MIGDPVEPLFAFSVRAFLTKVKRRISFYRISFPGFLKTRSIYGAVHIFCTRRSV